MEARRGDFSPLALARAGGALYLVIIVLGLFAEMFVRNQIIVPGDAAATVMRMTYAEPIWRYGIVAELLAAFCTTGLAMIYFVLLNPVSRPLNLLATFFRMVGVAVQVSAVLFLVVALFPLGSSAVFTALAPEVRNALVSLAIRAHSHGFSVALMFTGCTFLVHGYLIRKSLFLPRVLGVLIQIAGVCYLANGFAVIVAPAIVGRLFPVLFGPVIVAELSLSLWLLVKGVNVETWLAANRGTYLSAHEKA